VRAITTRRRPPGPRGSLLLGSAGAIRRDPLAAYTEMARQYGDVVRLRFLLWPTYLVFDPEGVRHVLQEKHTNYSKDLYTYRMLKPVVGNGLITNDGPAWLRQRRLMQPLFHRQRLAEFGGIVSAACSSMLERWVDIARRGDAVDIQEEMTRVALQVAGLAFLRIDLSRESDEFGGAFAIANRLLADYVYSPFPPLAFPSRRNLRLRAASATLDRVVRRIIAERRRQPEDSGDVVSMLLQARDQDTGEGMDDQQVRDEVITLLFAGHDTTASALTWACYLLGRHEDAQRRLQAEAASVGAATVEDLPRLTYTRMVLEEAMRLYPPGWSLGRKALHDDEIGGYHIPAGSLVWVSPYVTHRHPAYWERPEEFDPERFTPERSASRPRFAYFPFSTGPRICIGGHFAMMVAQLTLASIARRYRVRLPPGVRVEPEALLSLRPRGSVPMLVEAL
jgi:cytochrome P450